MRIGIPGGTLLLVAAAAQTAASQVVRGSVVDDETQQPIAGARVEVLRGDRPAAPGTATDTAGGFTVHAGREGTFRLRAARVGYATVTTPDVSLANGDTVQVVVRLRAGTVLLAPLEVVSRPRRTSRSPRLSEAFERMERGMGGRFLTADDIRVRNASRLTDVITSAGVTVSGTRVWVNRTTCPPAVVVDGVLVTNGWDPERFYHAINLVEPGAVEIVEVYAGPAGMPPEWVQIGRCGLILIWSRRGQS